jgi:hypothetical protein
MGMSIGLTCACEGHFSAEVDGDDTTGVWYLVYRFADAHVKCGYMTPPAVADEEPEERAGKDAASLRA